MARSYSRNIAEAVNHFLKEDDWNFSFDEDRGVFTFGLSLKSRIKNVRYIIRIRADDYVVYAYSPMGPNAKDPKEMSKMLEFVARANYGLPNANFELDVRDGELRLKCFVDCEDALPSMSIIGNSIKSLGAFYERYGDGIVGVLFGGMSAEEAIKMCEGDDSDDSTPGSGSPGNDDDFDALAALLERVRRRGNRPGDDGDSV